MLWQQLSKIGVPPKFLFILKQLHNVMHARVLTGEFQSESFEVKTGERTSFFLPSHTFSIVPWNLEMVST